MHGQVEKRNGTKGQSLISFSTFLYPASDHTSYPFATQNEKDYFNLMSVYLDAVFYPKLDEIDFLQEGHRLEFEKADGILQSCIVKYINFFAIPL